MTEYGRLREMERIFSTVEIRENATGKTGIANTSGDAAQVWYGADDGSDDKVVTAEAFSRDFTVTGGSHD